MYNRADSAGAERLNGFLKYIGELSFVVAGKAALFGVLSVRMLASDGGKIAAALGDFPAQTLGFFIGLDADLAHIKSGMVSEPGLVLFYILLNFFGRHAHIAQHHLPVIFFDK